MIAFLQDVAEIYFFTGTEQIVPFRILGSPPVFKRIEQQLRRFAVQQTHFPFVIKLHRLKNVRSYDFFFEELEAGTHEMPTQLIYLALMTEVGEKKIPIQPKDSLHLG
jgi:hypothetical protein